MKRLFPAVLSVAFLAGCTATPSTLPRFNYDSLVQLRDAYVAAGGDCGSWVDDKADLLATDSGSCTTTTTISIYDKPDQQKAAVALAKIGAAPNSLLVGGNWMIQTGDANKLLPKLGGIVVTQ